MASTSRVTAVAKWGNSSAIRIPRSVMQKANLHEGDPVRFEVKSPGVILVRAARPVPNLEELVAKMRPEQQHREFDWGPPRGKEIW